jgi:hypothetical protein
VDDGELNNMINGLLNKQKGLWGYEKINLLTLKK